MIIALQKIGCLIGMIIVLTSCKTNEPYAYDISSINEKAPQQKALILLSSPQIYARETLADDRRHEAEFLEKLLEKSKDVEFQPQLRRELASISLLSSQLGLSFDPTLAVGYKRSKQIGDLEQDVRETQIRLQLTQLKQQINAIESGTATVPSASAPSSSQTVITTPPTYAAPAQSNLKDQVDDLRNHIDKVLTELKELTGDVKGTSISSSPQEAFRDRQAYRNELRAALGAVNLDDLHDADGNALFQLQFRATVLPGEIKDRYGAARLSITPPSLDVEYVNDLYHQLLSTVTYQLNLSGEATGQVVLIIGKLAGLLAYSTL